MGSVQNNLFPEGRDQEAISREAIVNNEKRRSKSRSKVWEKVVWFTRKAKGAKDGKNGSESFCSSPEFVGVNGAGNVDCLCGDDDKSKQKVRKARSFNYLKRRKVRQFGDELSSLKVMDKANLQDCGTATGTFHDFQSERRISRLERDQTMSSNSLLSEMARGINSGMSNSSPRKVKENVKSVLSLPIDDLSLNEGPGGDFLRTSPNQVRRSVSFSGTCSSWPRKKRSYLDNVSRKDLLSPPSKQKRFSKIKKRATFSGFDSCRVNLKTSFLSLCKEVKSTPHLPVAQVSQIRNQNGLTIGVIHFYKSPGVYRKEDLGVKQVMEMRHASLTDAELGATASLDVPQISLSSGHDQEEEATLSFLPKECDCDVCVPENCDTRGIHNGSMLQEHSCHGNPACDSPSGNADNEDNATGCFSFNIKSSDGQNSTISAFLLEVECSTNCEAGSPDFPVEDFAKEKTAQISCSSELNETGSITSAHDSSLSSDVSCPGSNILIKKSHVTESDCSSDEPMDILEFYKKGPDFQPDKGTLNVTHISPDNLSKEVSSRVVSSDNKISDSLRKTLHDIDAQKPVACSLPSVDKDSDIEVTPDSTGISSETQISQETRKNLWQTKRAVNGIQFKTNSEVILQWFREFNDEQKNVLLRRLLEECELPQMHMLSVAMGPVLHKSCPPNCQDMLAWLPHHVALHVLSFLDSVSLCRCSQVNRTWNNLASNPLLWQNLCGQPDWQLSRIGEENEKKTYTLEDGTVQWKKMFASRFLLHQNWLKGKCNVRTFEGHAQGISCVQFDDTRIASGSYDKTIRVWDITSDESDVVLTLSGHSGTVRCLNLNGNRLVSGSVDRSIKVWDLSFKSYWSGASCKVTMIGHMHTVRCLQVDDEKVVSGSYDKTLKVWDIKTGVCKLTLRGHNAAVLCVQFDDRKIVSGSYDKTIKVWSLAEGSCLMTLTGHHDAVTCLNLTFDSRKVISGSLDHNLKFWDLLNGKCIGTLDWIRSEGHTGVIRCLQTDSWRIVSAGDDKTLKMWSLESGQRLLTLRCHTDGVTCLQFNDYSIVSGSYDKTVKLWDFTPSHEFLTPE